MATFSVDWEAWHDALHLGYPVIDRLYEPTLYILNLLDKYNIKATFYILDVTRRRDPGLYENILKRGHIIKSHGNFHYRGQKNADRQPYEFLGFCGGFWMRFLPYWLWNFFVILQNHCYIHPHDIMNEHPKLENPILNLKRQFGLLGARKKLERLLKEVKFEPSNN